VTLRTLADDYERNVFINCPFDDEYVPMLEALVFTIQLCGFRPLSARLRLDSGEVRLNKIVQMLSASRYSIHDLSRTELTSGDALPRFNMPLELGIDLGCRLFSRKHRGKTALIFDRERYRFQRYVSDIAGQDIADHGNDPQRAIARVRDWLRSESGRQDVPGPQAIYGRYSKFRDDLPSICRSLNIEPDELTFADFAFAITSWLAANPL
jgi:hypothetical protein